MELFNGDRLLQNDAVAFSEQLAPFPELPYHYHHHHELAPPASVHSPDEGEVGPFRCHNLPPQKLRPIRCTVRSSADCQGPAAGALSGCHSTDVEFLDSPVELGSGRGERTGKQPTCDREGRVGIGEYESTQSTWGFVHIFSIEMLNLIGKNLKFGFCFGYLFVSLILTLLIVQKKKKLRFFRVFALWACS